MYSKQSGSFNSYKAIKPLGLFFLISTIFFCFLFSYSQYSREKNQIVQVRGDVDVYGFDASNSMKVDVSGSEFTLIEDLFNVTVNAGDCQIESIALLKGKEKGASFLDVVIPLNITGKLDVFATNIDMLYFGTEGNTEARLYFDNQASSGLPRDFLFPQARPNEDLSFYLTEQSSFQDIYISVSNRSSYVSMFFTAVNGSLQINGDENFFFPLERDTAGLVLEVSVPGRRAYTAQIKGKTNEIIIEDWDELNYFFGGSSYNSSLYTKFPYGELSYSSKTKKVLGSENLNFTDFLGNINVTPAVSPNLYRIKIFGSVTSLFSDIGGRTFDILEKTYLLDYLWSPYPILISGISLIPVYLLWIHNLSGGKNGWDRFLLFFTLFFCLGSLVWSIRTEQPSWWQSFFSFLPVFVTIISYLAKNRKN